MDQKISMTLTRFVSVKLICIDSGLTALGIGNFTKYHLYFSLFYYKNLVALLSASCLC